MHYVLFYELADDYMERRPPLRNQHLAQAWQAEEAGDLLLAGVLDDPADRVIFIFNGRSAAERFAETDPYVAGGLVRSWQVRPWDTVVGREASTPVRPDAA